MVLTGVIIPNEKKDWIKWIQKKKNPDVLALQELCGYDEEKA